MAGKPHRPIAAFVRERLGPTGVMVGDRPETDGRFAAALGYDFGLVLTGVVSAQDLPVEPEPAVIAADLGALVDRVLGEASAGGSSRAAP
ncbi:MAG: HAD hydrolase-like protein [Acidimicrobiales bacterium]